MGGGDVIHEGRGDVRRHTHPLCHRSGRPSGSRSAPAARLRRACRLSAQRLSHEKPGQTLQATALVHEAYLRLVGSEDQHWESRGHFFAAAAEAMRRILVDSAAGGSPSSEADHGNESTWTKASSTRRTARVICS